MTMMSIVFILHIRIVLTDLVCVLCIGSSANFLHVHSTKHVWRVTPDCMGPRLLDNLIRSMPHKTEVDIKEG